MAERAPSDQYSEADIDSDGEALDIDGVPQKLEGESDEDHQQRVAEYESAIEKKEQLTPEQKFAFAYRDLRAAKSSYEHDLARELNLDRNNGLNPDDVKAEVLKTSVGADYIKAEQIFDNQARETVLRSRTGKKVEFYLNYMKQQLESNMRAVASDSTLNQEEKLDRIKALKESVKDEIERADERLEKLIRVAKEGAPDNYRIHKNELKDIDTDTSDIANPGSSQSEVADNYRGVGQWMDIKGGGGHIRHILKICHLYKILKSQMANPQMSRRLKMIKRLQSAMALIPIICVRF